MFVLQTKKCALQQKGVRLALASQSAGPDRVARDPGLFLHARIPGLRCFRLRVPRCGGPQTCRSLPSARRRVAHNDHPEPMSMANRSPSAIDRQIGVRLRMRRLTLDMSQEKFAAAFGISFQQVQKYEKGVNRIGAGRLPQIAEILQVPIAFFYEDFPTLRRSKSALPPSISDFLGSGDGLALAQAFVAVRDARQRRCIVILVEAMAR
jgi:transcriptional regulator with XRE-family HTH domain